MPRLTGAHRWIMIEAVAEEADDAEDGLVVYSTMTPWWWIYPGRGGMPYTTRTPRGFLMQPGGQEIPSIDLPCDPFGAPLLQTSDVLRFLREAEANPDHYGRHGLRAFTAAYHGNVVDNDGKPTAFQSWEEYNALLDVAGL